MPQDNLSLRTEIVTVPKQHWVDQRLDGYSDWSLPFWRELFQNSVDNGADRIDIRMGPADGRGAFGEAASVGRVVRVNFADNGTGMDEDTIRKVFFSAGASTKRGVDGKTGGFGTARIMLCWSQARYAIRTNGLFVEGDGSSFTCERTADAIATRRAMLTALEASGETARAAIVRADIAALEGGAADRKGAEFEIDIDPTEGTWNKVDEAKLRRRLTEYLEMSQVPAKVFLNGEEIKLETRRGPARRQLTAEIEGESVPFASVHLSESKKAKYKGKVIVRVNGAVMFTRDTEAQQQVIVELDPAMSRSVLTDSRDGMKGPFQDSFSAFMDTMAVDTQTALKEMEDRKYEVIRGSLGDMRILREDPAKAGEATPDEGTVTLEGAAVANFLENAIADEQRRHDKDVRGLKPIVPLQNAEVAATAGDALASVMEDVRANAASLLETVPESLRPEWEVFAAAAGRDPSRALASASPALAAHLLLEVRRREVTAGTAAGPVHVHDLHVLREDKFTGDKRMQYAMRVWKPTFWKVGDKAFGGGTSGHWNAPHQLFAVWTACVRYAVDILAQQHPSLAKDGGVKFATGWYFGKSKEEWNYETGRYEPRRTGAKYRKLDDGTHVFLLNPVLDSGEPAFDLAADDDAATNENGVSGMGRILALVKHEVAHAVSESHNERFASALTKLDSAFSQIRHIQGVHKAAKAAADAVAAAYGRGSSRLQAMDPDVFEGPVVAPEAPKGEAKGEKARSPRRLPRPAERLMAHAAPLAMGVIGAVASPENESLPGAREAMETLASASTVNPDGTRTIDCDRLAAAELAVSATMKEARIEAAGIARAAEAPEPSPEPVRAAPAASGWDSLESDLDFAAEHASTVSNLGDAFGAPPPREAASPPAPVANGWDDLDTAFDAASSYAVTGSLADLAGEGQVEVPMLPPPAPVLEPVAEPVRSASIPAPRAEPAPAAPLVGAEMSLDDFGFDTPLAAPAPVPVPPPAPPSPAPPPPAQAPLPPASPSGPPAVLVSDPRLDALLGEDFEIGDVSPSPMRR